MSVSVLASHAMVTCAAAAGRTARNRYAAAQRSGRWRSENPIGPGGSRQGKAACLGGTARIQEKQAGKYESRVRVAHAASEAITISPLALQRWQRRRRCYLTVTETCIAAVKSAITVLCGKTT